MSGDQPPHEQPLAMIEYQPMETLEEPTPSQNQPSQPRSLQDLIRYAMEASGAQPHEPLQVGPLDKERREFLEEALSAMTIDVIKLLQEQVKLLLNAEHLSEDADIKKQEAAFNIILTHIDEIDIANDFHKIGGFSIFVPCFRSYHWQLRAFACEVLGVLCQNNPYCQKVVVERGLIVQLIQILDCDADDQVCVKALFAISCIVRENNDGFNQLVEHQGLYILLKTLQRGDDKLRTKTAFLLTVLCKSHADLKSRLIFLEYIPVLISLISQPRMPSHEHILSLMLDIVKERGPANYEFRQPEYRLSEILHEHLDAVRNKPEFQEEERYCRKLIHILFTDSRNGM